MFKFITSAASIITSPIVTAAVRAKAEAIRVRDAAMTEETRVSIVDGAKRPVEVLGVATVAFVATAVIAPSVGYAAMLAVLVNGAAPMLALGLGYAVAATVGYHIILPAIEIGQALGELTNVLISSLMLGK